MPTYARLLRFDKDLERLSPEQRSLFDAAVRKFVADLGAGGKFRVLRVKGVEGAEGIFELTWAPDGRATFQYGESIKAGEPHIIWRRVGSHDVLSTP